MKNTQWQVMFGPTGHMLKKIKVKNNPETLIPEGFFSLCIFFIPEPYCSQ